MQCLILFVANLAMWRDCAGSQKQPYKEGVPGEEETGKIGKEGADHAAEWTGKTFEHKQSLAHNCDNWHQLVQILSG